jgi:hypothetical protein
MMACNNDELVSFNSNSNCKLQERVEIKMIEVISAFIASILVSNMVHKKD